MGKYSLSTNFLVNYIVALNQLFHEEGLSDIGIHLMNVRFLASIRCSVILRLPFRYERSCMYVYFQKIQLFCLSLSLSKFSIKAKTIKSIYNVSQKSLSEIEQLSTLYHKSANFCFKLNLKSSSNGRWALRKSK